MHDPNRKVEVEEALHEHEEAAPQAAESGSSLSALGSLPHNGKSKKGRAATAVPESTYADAYNQYQVR